LVTYRLISPPIFPPISVKTQDPPRAPADVLTPPSETATSSSASAPRKSHPG